MNVVPLYGPVVPAACDAKRPLTAPGGYQCWSFEAQDHTGAWHLSASFCEGFPLHPQYLRRYRAYLRRPTKVPPPQPNEYPCVIFTLYHLGRTAAQCLARFRPEDSRAAIDRLDVRMGANHFSRHGDGSIHLALRGIPWGLTLLGPRPVDAQQVTANLVFRPTFAHGCLDHTLASREAGGESAGFEHHWMPADALCHVQGTIRFYGHGGIIESQAIPFTGLGSHERSWGTGPLTGAFRRYLRGRLLLENRSIFLHLFKPAAPGAADGVQVAAVDPGGFEWTDASAAAHNWRSRTLFQVRYPSRIECGQGLTLTHPTLVAATPLSARIHYRATSLKDSGTATCDVIYPHRAVRPVVGHLFSRAIHDH